VITFEIDNEIILRPFKNEDAKKIFTAVTENYDHLRAFLHWVVPEYNLGSAMDFIAQSRRGAEEKSSLGFGIFEGQDLIGSIGFVNFDWPSKRSEIGYWIAKGQEGRGIITKSCKLLLNYAFGDLKLNRIEIRCAAENVRSRAVPERLGFTKEAVLRQSAWRHDRFYDMVIYGILKDEWLRTTDLIS
jgi:ribosomal-protein-serine acetyltransferase